MKRLLTTVLLGFISLVNAQTVETTPNLITSGTTHTWSGVTTGSLPANYMPGGPTPIYDPATNTISFSYNANAYVGQVIAVNQALANAGAGIKINGYNYSYEIRNMNGDDRQSGIDTITVAQVLRGANNSSLLSSNQYYNTKFDWRSITGTKIAPTPIDMALATYLQIGITGGDGGFWAGYFGPQIRNVSMSLNYTVDPCAANPAYSPTCANYNTVSISESLLSGTTGVQAYAINSALAQAGAGATIHGFNYGYTYSVSGRTCSFIDLFGLCVTGWNYSDAGVNTLITRSNGTTLWSENNTHNGGDNGTSGTYSKQYRLGSSVPMSTLGTFSMTPWTSGNASVTNMYSSAVYTPDPCVVNPLSSTSCSGYAAAFYSQQCSINALYDSGCPGYAAAYLTQQCNANQLYDTTCPGYAVAYLNYQCSLNSLYSTTCSGYSTALSQCTINPLGNQLCPAYQTATTECSSNPLYGTYCPGYASASSECSNNPLSHSYCPAYQTAIASCAANELSYSYCPGYQSAQNTCTTNPLSNSLCTNYQIASTNCSANPLYASYCPGYAFAYSCSQDGLYSNQCPNYSETYAKKNILNIGTNGTSTNNTTASSTTIVLVQASDPVAQATPVVADPVVNSIVTTKSTTANADANPAAVVKITPAAPATSSITTTATTENKKSETQTTVQATTENKSTDKPQTAREAIAEQRKEAARKEAVAKGKDLANEMGKATDMAAQVEVQNVVLQAMGYTPGFDNYGRFILPDAMGYKPYTIYNNQRTVDTPSGRGLFGGSDNVHQRMVDSQYNLGN